MGVHDVANPWRQRAEVTFSSIEQHLYDSRRALYVVRREFLHNSYEALWPFAGAWFAACSYGALDDASRHHAHLESFIKGLGSYHRNARSFPALNDPIAFRSHVVGRLSSGGDPFFDDNSWVALALLHQHRLTNDERCLALAERVTRFVLSGWSEDEGWSHPGGIRWKASASSKTRNTCSNAPVAEAAAELFVETGDEAWLQWSIRIYRWVRNALLGSDDLYSDRIDPDGSIVPARWTYNQGAMIGAGTLLAPITGDNEYLTEAVTTADATIARFDAEAMLQQAAPFNAVFARNLLLLDQVRPDPRFRELIANYGENMWTRHRDVVTGLFTGTSVSPLNRSAPMVEVYALLAASEPAA